jgi:hypothetical protein
MAMDLLKNFAYSGVQVPPTPANLGTSITVYGGTSNRFPAPPFSVSIWPIGLPADPTNAEIVRVTAVVGDIWQIVRQQEGSSARAIEANDQIAQAMTVKTINDLKADLQAYTNSAVAPLANKSYVDAQNAAQPTILFGPRGSRPSGKPDGTLFYEQDTKTVALSAGSTWFYVTGIYPQTFASRPLGLTVNDTGFLWYCTGYEHLLMWNGSDWRWGPGEAGSGYFADFAELQDNNRWGYCDGRTVTVLKINPLREESLVLPGLNNGYYRRGAGGYGLFSAANGLAVASAGGHSHGNTTGNSLSQTEGVMGGVEMGHAAPGGGSDPEVWYQHKHAINLHAHAIGVDGAHAHGLSGEYHPARLDCYVYLRR